MRVGGIQVLGHYALLFQSMEFSLYYIGFDCLWAPRLFGYLLSLEIRAFPVPFFSSLTFPLPFRDQRTKCVVRSPC